VIVTDEWLTKNMTLAGGYTKRQLALLNVSWPPARGWKRWVIGKPVNEVAAREFELLAGGKADDSVVGLHDAAKVDTSADFVVWSDGACDPNPGVGGWGWHRSDGVSAFGGEPDTTNNRMEMTAILEALKALPDGARVILHTDSQYCVNGLTVWSAGWARKDWRKKGEPMPNRDLWLALDAEKKRVRAEFRWVRGHNGDAGNEKADRLAVMGRETLAVAA